MKFHLFTLVCRASFGKGNLQPQSARLSRTIQTLPYRKNSQPKFKAHTLIILFHSLWLPWFNIRDLQSIQRQIALKRTTDQTHPKPSYIFVMLSLCNQYLSALDLHNYDPSPINSHNEFDNLAHLNHRFFEFCTGCFTRTCTRNDRDLYNFAGRSIFPGTLAYLLPKRHWLASFSRQFWVYFDKFLVGLLRREQFLFLFTGFCFLEFLLSRTTFTSKFFKVLEKNLAFLLTLICSIPFSPTFHRTATIFIWHYEWAHSSPLW